MTRDYISREEANRVDEHRLQVGARIHRFLALSKFLVLLTSARTQINR